MRNLTALHSNHASFILPDPYLFGVKDWWSLCEIAKDMLEAALHWHGKNRILTKKYQISSIFQLWIGVFVSLFFLANILKKFSSGNGTGFLEMAGNRK